MTFAELFKGNNQSFGQWNPKNSKSRTEKFRPKDEHFDRHLSGKYGIGRVPIMEDNTCWWGAIDIDCHEEGKVINLDIIAKTIFSKGLPLVLCRSKSGGAHCYVFLSKPIPANIVKKVLSKWAGDLGYQESEIFPKQNELRDNQLGNWINLPYFNTDKTNRYAIEMRDQVPTKLTFDEFMIHAEGKRLSQSDLESFITVGHEQAPPCIQRMMLEGVPKGYRNEALYAFTTYLKRKGGGYKEAAHNLNLSVFDRPLSISEAGRTIQSASRKEYKYKCQEEPCRSYCDSAVCVDRKYGIERSDEFDAGDNVPEFTRLCVINTEPPIWELYVNDIKVEVDTKTLRHFPYLAEAIMERLYMVVPILKQKEWMLILGGLMEKLEHVSAPDDASIAGGMRNKLIEFAMRADFNDNGKNFNNRELVNRGMPVVQDIDNDGKRVVIFKGNDFKTYLKRTKSEDMKGNTLWVALRDMGVNYKRLRIGGKATNLWVLPIDGKGRTMLDEDYNADSVFVHNSDKKVVPIMDEVNF